jgi:multidrug efflux pump subunit AcrB
MTKFWTFFIEKNHFTIFLIGVLIAGGTYAVFAIPKESTPDISIPLGIVTTVLPGASASDVERLVTDKIEDNVLSVENVSKVTSSSIQGVSSVSVEFEASADIDKSIALLKDAVDAARQDLPEDATDPVVSDVNFADQPILIVSLSGNFSPEELTTLGETAQDEVERLPGIASVELSGVREREVQVIVKQEKLAQYRLSLSDVTQAIAGAGIGAPTGSIVVDDVTYAVRFDGGISSTEDVANAVIAGPNGIPLKVADVAQVIDGLSDPTSVSRVSVLGEPANPSLTLTVYKSRGGNIVDTAERVKTHLESLRSGILANTAIVVSYDGAKEVSESLSELTRAGIETIILVVLVLFATLGLREALVAAVSIPLSFLIAFIFMLFTGNTLNNVSLFSLILAIGILVDSGVVVVEAFHTRLRRLASAKDAAIAAIEEYAWPLIAGTFTTIVVFIPLFFLSGIVGKFLASIPYTVIFVLLASIFVALGFVPLLAMLFVKEQKKSKLAEFQERYNTLAHDWYERFLHTILADKKWQNRFLGTMGVLFIIALLLPSTGLLKSIFFPQGEFDYVYVNIEKPQGNELFSTDLSVREVEEILYQTEGIESFATVVSSGSSFSGGFEGPSRGSNIANITINLPEDGSIRSGEFVETLRRKLGAITSATVTVGEPDEGPPSSAPISITFSGDDLGELSKTAERATRMLADIEGVINITNSARNAGSEFVITLDPAKATELGVSAPAVASTLRTALFSTKATSIRSGKDDIEVRTKLDLNPEYLLPFETTHASIDAVAALTVEGARGKVPLGTVATITYEPSQTDIRHEAGRRITTVNAEVAPGVNAIEVTQEFTRRFDQSQLGEGVTLKQSGESEDVAKSFLELTIALVAGVALMLSILILEFNSFRHSFYLLLIVPLSLIGVHAGLTLMGQPLSLTSMLGVIALAGVIINHAIILMDSIARIGKHAGVSRTLESVVVEASASRLRPIILTTIVTVIGMMPLALVNPFWAPLAFSIMYGLAFSLLLTLVLIPILYYRWPGKKVREQFLEDSGSSSISAPVLPPLL